MQQQPVRPRRRRRGAHARARRREPGRRGRLRGVRRGHRRRRAASTCSCSALGRNGHIGFNEPCDHVPGGHARGGRSPRAPSRPTAACSTPSTRCRAKPTPWASAPSCGRAGSWWWPAARTRPQIVHDAFFGPVTPQVPASRAAAPPRRDGHRGREGGGAVRVGAPDERRAKLAPPPATNEHVRKSMQGNKGNEHQAGDARARAAARRGPHGLPPAVEGARPPRHSLAGQARRAVHQRLFLAPPRRMSVRHHAQEPRRVLGREVRPQRGARRAATSRR